MTSIFVDTDIIIDYSKGHSRFLETLLAGQERGDMELFINPVVVAEFMTDRSLRDEKKRSQAAEFLQFFSLKDVTKFIGVLAGELLREGQTAFLGDAMIAATCVINKFQLATRNIKHFKTVPSLVLHQE
ncbi:PIN domain-containing protein [Candidatus Gottesmanbacteria bacterium]|nr:PIN domain-containing protein [Candidatus Gottesmanbacteria bacterium]